MAWVRSEYAGELAVLSAWLSALLPWNVTYVTFLDGQVSALFVRFPFVQLRYLFGISLEDGVRIDHPIGARGDVAGNPVLLYDLWIAGAAIILTAVVLSILLYVDEDGVEERLPVHPVRLMGGLLGVATVVLSASTVAILTRGDFGGGLPIPVGLVVLGVLSWVLLTVELT